MSPFDFLNSINLDKKDLFEDPQAEKDYNGFMINRGLSYFPDTIFYANEMNIKGQCPKRWQFDFLRHSIPPKKRFSKWHKKEQVTEDLKLIQEWYKYSEEKALEVLSILSEEQVQEIKQKLYKGGR